MKKVFALCIALVLILSAAACGNSGKTDVTEPAADDTAAQAVSDAEAEDATEPQDDAAAAAALQEQIVGTWGFPGDGGEDAERLVFNADGTGDYQSLDKHYTFTYVIYIDHRAYANGAPYTENMFTVTFDTGDVEDIIFFFTESGKLAFHNSDDGGYFGMFDNFGEYTKL